ncbi:hypothetical protein LOAG_09391 [Loa loa]|uniref:Uncharacterized protein n=1 Tax=Loa loa TaxID=7209 RepID=A0A1S0TS02_LOALO|nr:hypothetical protein LOAG_09391 [Loa loa]EFO19103.1 hypothetical protein LOAG_09391 [Loa loa]
MHRHISFGKAAFAHGLAIDESYQIFQWLRICGCCRKEAECHIFRGHVFTCQLSQVVSILNNKHVSTREILTKAYLITVKARKRVNYAMKMIQQKGLLTFIYIKVRIRPIEQVALRPRILEWRAAY